MREYVIDVVVTKRVRVACYALSQRDAELYAADAALYDDTQEVINEHVADTSVVWRGRGREEEADDAA